jgi:hypothetical protein
MRKQRRVERSQLRQPRIGVRRGGARRELALELKVSHRADRSLDPPLIVERGSLASALFPLGRFRIVGFGEDALHVYLRPPGRDRAVIPFELLREGFPNRRSGTVSPHLTIDGGACVNP